MSSTSTIGEIKKTEYVFEWRIRDFFSLSLAKYASPTFNFDGEPWHLIIYPIVLFSSTEYVYISFVRELTGTSKKVFWSFTLKTENGKKHYEQQYSHFFGGIQKNDFRGTDRFLERSKLLEKKSILVPSGILTVVCTIFDCSEYARNEKDLYHNFLVCSYCGKVFHDSHLSIHEEMCLNIRCTACKEKWDDHECSNKANQKLVEDFAAILNSGEHSDLRITVKDTEFRLHRAILASRNPYFNSMLNTEMKEKVTGTVSIQDCEPDVFRSFIHFVYTGKVDKMSVENVYDLYVLADRYQADQLKGECLHFMGTEMCVDTFCDLMAAALNHDERELLQKATKFFCKNIKQIIKSVKWQSFVEQYFTQSNELITKALDFYDQRLHKTNCSTK